MISKLTIQQLLTALEPGKAMALSDPQQPEKVLIQASRVGEVYYVTGPLFQEYAPEVDLAGLFEVGLANDDDQASVMRMLNQYLGDHGVPVAAQLHACQGLVAACTTLGALWATSMRSTKRI